MIYVHVVWSMKLFPARHVENIYIKIRKLLFLIIVVCGIVLYQVCLFARRNGNNSEKKTIRSNVIMIRSLYFQK